MARWLMAAASTIAATAAAAASPTSRQSFSLDGDWKFTLHAPSAAGGALGPAVQAGKIAVPGSWEAQGYGNETIQMNTQVLTGDNAKGARGAVGVYTLAAAPSACDNTAATRVLTVDRGIHRHAIFKVGGKVVGEHIGYLTPFEAPFDCDAEGCDVEIMLDGGRNPASDPLM